MFLTSALRPLPVAGHFFLYKTSLRQIVRLSKICYYESITHMAKIDTSAEKVAELLSRGVTEIIDQKDLEKKLMSGKQLRVKLGIDPTSPNIHLGRSIPLLKLRDFQKLGHKIVFIIGDFTGVIGDTSDKDSERPMLTPAVIKKNLKSYIAQASKIIDIKKAEVHYNSKWLKKLSYSEIGLHRAREHRQAPQGREAHLASRAFVSADAGIRLRCREIRRRGRRNGPEV